MSRNNLIFGALASFVATSGVAYAQDSWKYVDGQVSVQFDQRALSRLGATINNETQSVRPALPFGDSRSWRINTNRSTFNWFGRKDRTLQAGGGELEVDGGFMLNRGGLTTSFRDFTLYFNQGGGTMDLRMNGYSYPPYQPVQLVATRPTLVFNQATGQLGLNNYELSISDELASAWGAPNVSGTVIGHLTITGDMTAAPTKMGGANGNERSALDLGLCQLTGLRLVSGGPKEQINGYWYSALTAATLSNNYGTGAITWIAFDSPYTALRQMHPTIGLNTYRKLATGELEQIGEGQLKHGWYAVNGSSCASCGSGINNGLALGQGCADPYSSGNNENRGDIGPKSEVNPYTGIWNTAGSWFDTRGNPSYTPTQMYMKVAHVDIVPGASYYYEGYYMAGFVNNSNASTTNASNITQMVDVNKFNNFAWSTCNFSVTTSTSTSTSTLNVTSSGSMPNQSQVNHPQRMPLIMTWGDGRQIMEPTSVGNLVTAYRVTPVSGDPGWYKYDYAVYNVDLDRQVRSFHVSVDDSVNVRNITFRDIDKDNANEWTMTRANGDISWEMLSATPNPLVFGRLYNFRFEAQAAAVPSWASATMIKSGDFPELNHAVTGPPPSTQPITGTITIPNWVGPVPAQVDLRLTPVDSGSLTNVNDVPVGPSGAISAATQVRGRYLVSVGGAPFLRKNFAPVVTIGHDGNDIPINVTLISGDVDGSGEIDAADIDMVISQFGLTDPTVCDVDGSGEVDAADIDLVIGNFGQTGD